MVTSQLPKFIFMSNDDSQWASEDRIVKLYRYHNVVYTELKILSVIKVACTMTSRNHKLKAYIRQIKCTRNLLQLKFFFIYRRQAHNNY
jgi:hypothetical protein